MISRTRLAKPSGKGKERLLRPELFIKLLIPVADIAFRIS